MPKMSGGSGNGGQGLEDGVDTEDSERCPICLGPLGKVDLAVPDSCCHVFCLGCILRWAEMVPSCPMDRRQFSVVYKRDAVLGCIKVPVRRRTNKSELEMYGCKEMGISSCLLKGKHRQQHDFSRPGYPSDLSVMIKKKSCCTRSKSLPFSASPFTTTEASLGSLSQCFIQTVEVAEEPAVEGCKHCRQETQDIPWLPVAMPVITRSLSRYSLHHPVWGSSSFPMRPSSPLSTSLEPLGFRHFVFQGRVCAVTSPKGEDKKNTQASGSKGPSKSQMDALGTRHSTRHSKADNKPLKPNVSSAQLPSSNSDSCPTNWPVEMGRGTKVVEKHTDKRKGKQTANQKTVVKRKGTTRRKMPVKVLSSEEEEEADEEDEQQGKEEEDDSELQILESEQNAQDRLSLTPSPEDHSSEASDNTSGHGNEEMDNHPDVEECTNVASLFMEHELRRQEQEAEVKEEDLNVALVPEEVCKSPNSFPRQTTSTKDAPEQHAFSGEKDNSESSNPTSPGSTERPPDSPLSPSCNRNEDMNMSVNSEPTGWNKETKVRIEMLTSGSKSEATPSPTLGPESTCSSPHSERIDGDESQQVQSPKVVRASKDLRANNPEDHTFERLEDDLSQGNTEAITMDCESLGSEPRILMEDKSTPFQAPVPSSWASEAEKEKESYQNLEPMTEQKSLEKKDSKSRRSRFHSPTTTWSPKRELSRRSRSHSMEQERDDQYNPPSCRSSRPHSRERERKRDGSRGNHSHEKKTKKFSRSRSRTRSRSRSKSRTVSYRRGLSPERTNLRGQSPRRRDRWREGEGWQTDRGNDLSWRNLQERQSVLPAKESVSSNNGGFEETSPDRGRSENPDWVQEKTLADSEARAVGIQGTWNWSSERGRATGRGRVGYRPSFSETSNNSGNDAYSRFNDNRGSRRKPEDQCDLAMDRSGWSSASSWAVRRTLPADVQNYYSRKERGGGAGGGVWSRQEEDQTAAAPLPSDTNAQALGEAAPALNMMPPQLNVVHYTMRPRGQPVSLQPTPFGVPPQMPVHLHPAVPLLQVSTVATQGLPPPPPPPPPMQQGSLTATHGDSQPPQAVKTSFLPTPNKPRTAAAQNLPSVALPSSTTLSTLHSKVHADSSKKEKRLLIQERAINEVKNAIKPYYQKKDITKEEYKEIVRKAVEKVCHSKSGEVNSGKVANLVKAYVDKYKHARKK